MPKNKNKNKGSNKSKQKYSLYDPRQSLTGKDLRKFVNKLARQETRGEVRSQKTSLATLQAYLDREVAKLSGLGQQASSNIASYYQQLAGQEAGLLNQQQALGMRLTGDVASSTSRSAGNLQQAGSASLAGLDADAANRQQTSLGPSSAREELQALIASQQNMQGRESASLNAYASGQAHSSNSLAGAMAAANQARGGQIKGDTNREILNRIADLQSQYAPDIMELMSGIAETKRSKSDLKHKLLMELRGAEREYLLSKAALGIDRKSLKAELSGKTGTLATAKQYGKNKKKEQLRSLRNQLRVIEAQSGAKAREQARSLRNQIAVIQAQGGGSGGSGANKLAEYDKSDKQRALSYVRTAYGSKNYSRVKANKQDVVDRMNRSYGVNPVLGRWAVKQYLKGIEAKRKEKQKEAGTVGEAVASIGNLFGNL